MQQFHIPSGFTPGSEVLGGTPMSEIIDTSFFSEYSPKGFSPTDVFSSPRAGSSTGPKPLVGSGGNGIAMAGLEPHGLRSADSESDSGSPGEKGRGALDVLATVSAEKAERPKGNNSPDSNQDNNDTSCNSNIGSEMDNGEGGSPSLGPLNASPIGMDDNMSDADSPLLGARLSDYAMDRTAVDSSSSICLSSSLADISASQTSANMSYSQTGTATKRKLQNISGLADGSTFGSQSMHLQQLSMLRYVF